MKVLLLLAAIAMVSGECPEACNGHGFCGEYDKCSCYRNYQGNSCADRACPFDLAFVDLPHGDLNMDGKNDDDITVYGAQINDINAYEVYPTDGYQNGGSTLEKAASFYDQAEDGHFYAECSNKGMCDRKSGQCDCFDGYSGTACRRVACPNDCSGHGTCETLDEFTAKGTNSDTRWADGTAVSYTLWDRYKTQVCQCDAGYFGIDCAQRHCPFGDDPLTTDQHNEIQWLEIKSTVAAEALAGTFKLSYEDEFGEIWDTMPIAAQDYSIADPCSVATCESGNNAVCTTQAKCEAESSGVWTPKNDDLEAAIKSALEGIPNSVFEEVAVEVWPIQEPIPGHFVCEDTAFKCTFEAASALYLPAHVDTVFTAAGLHGLSNCKRGFEVGAFMTAGADAGVTTGLVVSGTGSELAGTIFGTAVGTSLCHYHQHGVRAKITFTKNSGNINELKCDKSTASTSTAAGTSAPDSGVACQVTDALSFTLAAVYGGATGTNDIHTNADFSNFMTHGDRFTIGGVTHTIAGPIVAPQDAAAAAGDGIGAVATILVEETIGKFCAATSDVAPNTACTEHTDCKSSGTLCASTGHLTIGTGAAGSDVGIFATAGASDPLATWNGQGTTERVECSHRGLCNHDDGLCECFTGYTHDDCSMQDALNA